MSNTSNIRLTWKSPISALYSKKSVPGHLPKLTQAGYVELRDLLKIIPLNISPCPKLESLLSMREGRVHLGKGKIKWLNSRTARKFSKKGKIQLLNISYHLV